VENRLNEEAFIARAKEIIMMTHVPFKAALILIFLASIPLHLRAAAQGSLGEPLRASQVKKAETEAKTQTDHLRLVVYYPNAPQVTRG
jgi:hypothetical protein